MRRNLGLGWHGLRRARQLCSGSMAWPLQWSSCSDCGI